MTRISLCIAIVLGTNAAPAMAQDITCDPSGTQAQMNVCAFEDFERADAALNAAYKTAMRVAKEGGFDAELREAQRKWLPFRDAACDAEAAQFRGGSIVPLIAYSCLAVLTEERTRHLNAIQNY